MCLRSEVPCLHPQISGKLVSALGRPLRELQQREGSKDLQDVLEALGMPGKPLLHALPVQALSFLGALSLPRVLGCQGWDMEGQPVEPTVCIFLMGLELMQDKNQDPAFQREDTRQEKEGEVRAEHPD